MDNSQVVGGILLLVVNLPPMFTFFPFFPTHTIDTDMCTQVVVARVSSFTLQSSIGISDLDVATRFITLNTDATRVASVISLSLLW